MIIRSAMGYLFITLCCLLISACGGGGGSESVDPASSNWDQLTWDQDNWS